MPTEQEVLLSAFSGGRRKSEPFEGTDQMGDMLAASLKGALGAPRPDIVQQIEQEMKNSQTTSNKYAHLTSGYSTEGSLNIGALKNPPAVNGKVEFPETISHEQVLTSIYELYDNLIIVYEGKWNDESIAIVIRNSIQTCIQLIRILGGKVDDFSPNKYITGLKMPNMSKNAERVIATTKECYSCGNIREIYANNSKTIDVVFDCKQGSRVLVVNGKVEANEWDGNEAIDYIYDADGGQMSVKAFENGRWIDKTDSGRYDISWEVVVETEKDTKKEINIAPSKDVEEIIENDIVQDEWEDFPIIEGKNENHNNIKRFAKK